MTNNFKQVLEQLRTERFNTEARAKSPVPKPKEPKAEVSKPPKQVRIADYKPTNADFKRLTQEMGIEPTKENYDKFINQLRGAQVKQAPKDTEKVVDDAPLPPSVSRLKPYPKTMSPEWFKEKGLISITEAEEQEEKKQAIAQIESETDEMQRKRGEFFLGASGEKEGFETGVATIMERGIAGDITPAEAIFRLGGELGKVAGGLVTQGYENIIEAIAPNLKAQFEKDIAEAGRAMIEQGEREGAVMTEGEMAEELYERNNEYNEIKEKQKTLLKAGIAKKEDKERRKEYFELKDRLEWLGGRKAMLKAELSGERKNGKPVRKLLGESMEFGETGPGKVWESLEPITQERILSGLGYLGYAEIAPAAGVGRIVPDIDLPKPKKGFELKAGKSGLPDSKKQKTITTNGEPTPKQRKAYGASAQLLQSGSKGAAVGRSKEFSRADEAFARVIANTDKQRAGNIKTFQDAQKFADEEITALTALRTKKVKPYLKKPVKPGEYFAKLQRKIDDLEADPQTAVDAKVYREVLDREFELFSTATGKEIKSIDDLKGLEIDVEFLLNRNKKLNQAVSSIYNSGTLRDLDDAAKARVQALDLLRGGTRTNLLKHTTPEIADINADIGGLIDARAFLQIQRDRAKNAIKELDFSDFKAMSAAERFNFLKSKAGDVITFKKADMLKIDTKSDLLELMIEPKIRQIRSNLK